MVRYIHSSEYLIIVFVGVLISHGLDGSIVFLGGYDILESDVSTSSSTPVDTGISATNGSYTGKALVISSFSGEKTNNSEFILARYGLNYNGSAVGQPHFRNIQKSSSAAGAGSAIGVADILTANPITLQHSENNSKANLTTLAGSTLSVIPLTSGSYTLNHAIASVASPGVDTSSTSFSEVARTNSLSVPGVFSGTSEVFLMASFDVIANQSGQGAWKIQYRNTSGGSWTDAGNTARRGIGTSDGIVTISALADLSSSGNYEVRLVHASDGSASLDTRNVELVALSLVLDDTFYLQSYEAPSIGPTGAILDLPVAADTQVFTAANLTANSTANDTGTYSLTLDDTTQSLLLSASTREVDSGSLGSVSLSGIVSVTSGSNSSIELAIDSANLGISPDSNFVAFELAAIPELSLSTLIASVTGFFFVLKSRGQFGLETRKKMILSST